MNKGPNFFQTRVGFVFAIFLAIAGLMLVYEHRAHIDLGGDWTPWLLIGLCFGMHLFMHGGHSGHNGDDRE